MNYLIDFIPRDILHELCLYLKYHEIYTLVAIDNRLSSLLHSRHLWLWKLTREFNMNASQIDNTVMPLHLKYIELRSFKDVDWDSDLFIGPEEALLRAYKIKDRDLILNFIDMTTTEQQIKASRGAAVIGDTQMLNLCRTYPGNPLKINAMIREATLEGAAEGNQRHILNSRKNLSYINSEKYILGKGIARAGNYQLMDQYQIPVVSLYYNLAMQNGHLNFVLHYFNISELDKHNLSYSERENLKELITGAIIGHYSDIVKILLPLYNPVDDAMTPTSVDDLFNFLNVAMQWNSMNVIDLLFDVIQKSYISQLVYGNYLNTAIAYAIRRCHLDLAEYVIKKYYTKSENHIGKKEENKTFYTVSEKFLEECLLHAPDFVLDYLFEKNYISYKNYKEVYSYLITESNELLSNLIYRRYNIEQSLVIRVKTRHMHFMKKHKFLQDSTLT